MVEQRRASPPTPHGRARELLRNSLRRFLDPDRVLTKQLGLRFAAAKLPGLRTNRGVETLWNQAWA